MKVCLKCKQEKSLSEFNNRTRNKDGLETHCKECTRAEKRALRAKNPEKVRELEKRWHAKNKDKAKAIRQRTYQKNKEKRLESFKKYRENNKERTAAANKDWRNRNAEHCKQKAKKYRAENKESVKATIKEWLKRNPEFCKKQQKKLHERRQTDPVQRKIHALRTMTKMAVLGKTNGKLAEQILGIRPIVLKEIFKVENGLQVDHICPFAQAKTVDEAIKLAHYSNIRLVTAEENQAKKHKKTAEGEALCRALLGREWI